MIRLERFRHILFFLKRLREILIGMESNVSILRPPSDVRGMTELDVSRFSVKMRVPCVQFETEKAPKILKILSPYLLKLRKFKAVMKSEDAGKRVALLNPDTINETVKGGVLSSMGLSQDVEWREIDVGYDNWKEDEVLKAVLPQHVEGSSSYSRVGHIVQLNLRDHLKDYRFLIGKVLLDKLPGVKLVVNKVNVIESTFRNFQMEIIAGSGETVTTVKENGCVYSFDFALVYWNPRLSTEHERIVKMLNNGDVLFDVFAGVGPFSIPAAKKKCRVFANDLNPNCCNYLHENIKKNKVDANLIRVFNLDGKAFIQTVFKENVEKIWIECREKKKDAPDPPNIHVVMNLPAIAVDFLDEFKGLFAGYEPQVPIATKIHVYFFVRGENVQSEAEDTIRNKLNLSSSFELEYFYVRHVAPMKEMVRISFTPPIEFLLRKKNMDRDAEECEEKNVKRIKSS